MPPTHVYAILDTGSTKKAEKELTRRSQDGWELVHFGVAHYLLGSAWHWVALLRKPA